VLITVGLGSCVAVILHDAEGRIGGLAHVLLPAPAPGRPPSPEGRFALTAVPALLRAMGAHGARRAAVTARLVGGASMFANLVAPGSVQVGERNLVATREALATAGIAVVGESVGGDFGRSVEFDIASGSVLVTSYAHPPEHL